VLNAKPALRIPGSGGGPAKNSPRAATSIGQLSAYPGRLASCRAARFVFQLASGGALGKGYAADYRFPRVNGRRGPGHRNGRPPGNDSRAGSLDLTALGGVERKERPAGKQAPSIGSSVRRPQQVPPRWGRFFWTLASQACAGPDCPAQCSPQIRPAPAAFLDSCRAAQVSECVEQVQAKAPSNDERGALMTGCNARFAGRGKASGGYTYYDFMQDRKFDIAGPNPTAEERKQIDRAYMGFLDGNGAMLIRLNWLKDRTNSCGQIWKARVSLSGHRWFSPRRIYLPQPQNGRSIDRNRRAVKMVHYLAAGQSFPRS
jgi:hypothetical protein